MARNVRSSKLETRTARLKLPPRRKPFFQPVSRGIAVGYRRNATGAGTWSVRAAAGDGSNWLKKIGIADDHEDSNGATVLTFWEATDRARALARADDGQSNDSRPATIAEALDAYEGDLRSRSAGIGNVTRVRHNLPAALASKPVSLLVPRELRAWRDRMVKGGMAPASADRTARVLSAALSLAGRDDVRITNGNAWKTGLQRLPDSEEPRQNAILPDDSVRLIVSTAHAIDPAYGLLTELAAITGARRSQLLRCRVYDLEDDNGSPRVQMPSSRKGRRRKIVRKPLPISVELAKALRAPVRGRPADAPLLLRANGSTWSTTRDDVFPKVVAAAGLDTALTAYCLRHSSIVRALLAGVPLQLVASSHDTSAAIIAKHYARFIVDNSDTMLRRAMLDMGTTPTAPNVVPMSVGGRKS